MLRLSFRLGLRKKKMKRSKVVERGARSNSRTLFNPVHEIPEEVLIEILSRLPAKSLMRFKCVSKQWCSLISSRYFTNLFLNPSSLRERRVFLYLMDKNNCSLLSAPLIGSREEFHSINKVLTMPGMGGFFVNALRGLVCFRIGTRLRICNITTKQRVELPPLRSTILVDDSNMWSYFGYDPIKDEYKVVTLVWEITPEKKLLRSEHPVLVLGPGASWRRSTQIFPPHRPYSQGISIDCVLYYNAWTSENNRCAVVSFDMRSEEFNLIELPLEACNIWDTHATNIMNYGGRVAVFDYSDLENEGSMDLWVLEDVKKSQWSNKKSFDLPLYFIRFLLHGQLLIRGTSREGQIRCFEKKCSTTHVICDLDRSKMIGGALIAQELPHMDIDSLHINYWDDFESIIYLET